MNTQGKTGQLTEKWVIEKITNLGYHAEKPIPDKGVDLIVTSNLNHNKILKIQVKGRGQNQTNQNYRWFQIRTTKNQREETVQSGLPIYEAWRKKVDLADIFILVSERLNEFWIFTKAEIYQIVKMNIDCCYGKWKDYKTGTKVELNLEKEFNGKRIADIFKSNLNNWQLINDFFKE